MRLYKSIQLIIFLFITCQIYGQDSIESKKIKLQFSGMSMQSGAIFQSAIDFPLEGFEKMSPNSGILLNDFSTFNYLDYSLYLPKSMVELSGIFDLKKSTSNLRFNPKFSFGLGFSSGLSLAMYNDLYEPYYKIDSIFINRFNCYGYFDSIINKSVGIEYYTQNILLKGMFTIRSNTNKRFCIYGGFGLGIGITRQSRLEMYYSEKNEIRLENNVFLYNSDQTNDFETIQKKGGTSVDFFIPLGLDFRIGNKSEYWRMIHLFFEMREGFHRMYSKEIGGLNNSNTLISLGIHINM